MGLYTEQQKNNLAVKSGAEINFEAGSALKIAGVAVTPSAAELNRQKKEAAQTLVADGAITVVNGVCTIAKTVAGVVAATLADPVATTDDYKTLLIINGQTQANTVTSASSFGGGGGSFDVVTFTNVVGATLYLMAYQGKWYILGGSSYAIA